MPARTALPTPPAPDSPAETASRLGHNLLAWVTGPGLGLWVPLVTVTVAGLVLRLLAHRRWWRQQTNGARWLTVRSPAVVDSAGGVALWRNLTGLLAPAWRRWLFGQPHIGMEFRSTIDGLRIGFWVPRSVPPGLVEHAISAAWPGAKVATQPAGQSSDPVASVARGGWMGLVAPDWYPLSVDHPTDPLRPLLTMGGHLWRGETSVVRVIACPVTGRRLRRFRTAAYQLRHGHQNSAVPGTGVLGDLVDVVLPGPPSRTHHRDRGWGVFDPFAFEEIRVIRGKATHPQWATQIRYQVTTTRPSTPQTRERVRGLADELAATFAVFTGRNALRRHRTRHPITGWSMRRGFLLSVPELAAIAHLPFDENTPVLDWAGARSVAPRPEVPTWGKVLGEADTGASRPVAIPVPDARHHVHVLGATGTGKSTLLAHLILGEITARRGVLVIDPKGDLVTDIRARIPDRDWDRVVVFDPDDSGTRPGLNVLSGPDSHSTVDNLVGIFRRIYTDYWGPRTDDIFRSACLTLTHSPGASLADVPRLLTDPAYRTRLISSVTDPVLAGFWDWYTSLSEPARAHAIAPLMNKLRSLLLREFVRDTLCATGPGINLGRELDQGGICLVRVPKGVLGADTTQLFGSLVLAKAWEHATHRARTTEHTRPDSTVVLDECHNFLMLPHGIDDMLAEARAYRLSLVLAHQDLAQLPPSLRDGVNTNARNKVYFVLSPSDAHDLRRHVAPALSEDDLTRLDAFHATARLVVNHAPVPAFTFTTRPLPPPVRAHRKRTRRSDRPAPEATRAQRPVPAPARPAGVDPHLPTDSGRTM